MIVEIFLPLLGRYFSDFGVRIRLVDYDFIGQGLCGPDVGCFSEITDEWTCDVVKSHL